MTGHQNNPKGTVSGVEALMNSEMNFHSLFSAMTEGVAIHQMIYDNEGNAVDYIIRDVNASFEKNLGIPVDKAKGVHASILYGVTPPPYIEIYEHVLKTKEPYFFTTYFQPLDRYFEISVFIPKEGWFATVFLDVTGSRRVVEELRSTGNKYRRLYESMMDGFSLTDMEGRIKEFNSCFCEMLGYSESELLQLTFMDITPETWHEYEKRIIHNQVIPNGYSNVYEKEYRKKDGTVFPIEIRVSLIRDDKGNPESMWAVIRDITDRKNAEHEFEQLIDRLNLATRSAKMGVWEWDLKTNRPIWDDKMLELFGFERDEFNRSYNAWEKAVHPDDLSRMKEEIQKALTGKKEYDNDYRINLKDGSIRHIKAFAQVVRDSAGTPLRFTGVNYDITEQKKTQESLVTSEIFNRGLVESAPVGILFLDRTGMMTYENPAMQQMMGAPHDKESLITGKYFQDLAPIKDVLTEQEINRILHGDRINAKEIHYKSIYGKEVDLEIYTAPMLGAIGKMYGITLMAVDITKPVAAGKELRQSEQKYRNLYESMRDGFTLLDLNKRVIECNSFFLTLTGYTSEDIRKMPSIRSIIPEKFYSKVDDIINKQVMVNGYSEVFEIEYRRKDNTIFPVELRLFLHKNQDGTNAGMWGIVRDITDRKKMENELKELNTILEQRVEQKTKELQERVKELERFYKATIDREIRMKEMRTRIEELEMELEKLNK